MSAVGEFGPATTRLGSSPQAPVSSGCRIPKRRPAPEETTTPVAVRSHRDGDVGQPHHAAPAATRRRSVDPDQSAREPGHDPAVGSRERAVRACRSVPARQGRADRRDVRPGQGVLWPAHRPLGPPGDAGVVDPDDQPRPPPIAERAAPTSQCRNGHRHKRPQPDRQADDRSHNSIGRRERDLPERNRPDDGPGELEEQQNVDRTAPREHVLPIGPRLAGVRGRDAPARWGRHVAARWGRHIAARRGRRHPAHLEPQPAIAFAAFSMTPRIRPGNSPNRIVSAVAVARPPQSRRPCCSAGAADTGSRMYM